MFDFLNYLLTITRSNLVYVVSLIDKYNSNSNQEHLDAILKIYAYLIEIKHYDLFYIKDDREFKKFVDSNYEDCFDIAKSTTK